MCFIWFFRSLAILPWCTQQWRIGLCSLNGWSNWVVTSMPRTKNITPHYIWLRCIPGKVFRHLLRFDLSWPHFFHYGLFFDLVGTWWGFTEFTLGLLRFCWGFNGVCWELPRDLLGVPLGVHWGGLLWLDIIKIKIVLKWYQILRGFRKTEDKEILKLTALYLMWNLEICQDSPFSIFWPSWGFAKI